MTGDITGDPEKIAVRYLKVRARALVYAVGVLAIDCTIVHPHPRACRTRMGTHARTHTLTRAHTRSQTNIKGWFAVDLLATFPVDYVVRAVEGTWMCSLHGNCSWSAASISGGVSPISMLRVVRIFR